MALFSCPKITQLAFRCLLCFFLSLLFHLSNVLVMKLTDSLKLGKQLTYLLISFTQEMNERKKVGHGEEVAVIVGVVEAVMVDGGFVGWIRNYH